MKQIKNIINAYVILILKSVSIPYIIMLNKQV